MSIEEKIKSSEEAALLKLNFEASKQAYGASRRNFAVLALSAVAGALLLAKALYQSKFTGAEISNFFAIAGVAAGFLVAAFGYLNPRVAIDPRHQEELEEQVLKRRMVKKAEEVFDQEFAKRTFAEEDKEHLLKRVEQNMTAEAVLAYHCKIVEEIQAQARKSHITMHFARMSDRLGNEVEAQARRGTVNLILGIGMTAVGLGILGYSVYYAPSGKLDDLAGYFAPRLTLGILVQVFSYFFLRLYKQSLSEIKFFQNEITNIESQQLAILIAQNESDSKMAGQIVDSLVKTERNFLMSKDQTTIELERERMEQSKVTELIQAVKTYARPKD